jgi:RNA polymerase sigma-70 factor (ECF subfamily)
VRVLARPRLLREGDELPYLLATLRNVHRSAIRTAGRRPTTVRSDDLDSLPGRRNDPHVATVARQTVAAVAGLPAAQREVVVAVDLRGLSYAEAAAELRIPNGTVMSRLHRARTALAGSGSPRDAELGS